MTTKKQSIGALWVKQGAKGDYLSGYVEVDGQKVPLVCFINGYKKEAKHPDYQIYKSEPRQGQGERTETEQRAPLNETVEKPTTATQDDDIIYPDDIPF